MLNASNFSRNLRVNGVKQSMTRLSKGNRAARRKADAVLRQQKTNTGHLDGVNEKLVAVEITLHPTRGYRFTKHKRSIASTIVDMARQGFVGSTQDMKEAFANA